LLTLATLLASGAALGASRPAHNFSLQEVQTAFRANTGMRLVKFAAASTPAVTSLRTRPHQTPRFGEFQLFVLRPSRVLHLRRVFTHGTTADRRGIHWVPDQTCGWIAVTVFKRNLVVAWFPTPSGHDVDSRWQRLQHAVASFAPGPAHYARACALGTADFPAPRKRPRARAAAATSPGSRW
jgi:hypothetical protein